MLPPAVEVFVVWHPADPGGQEAAQQVFGHFQGTVFTGLIGGAIEVYIRSQGWRSESGAPRPIWFGESGLADQVCPARLVAVVPVLGNEFAAAVEKDGEWRDFARTIIAAREAMPERVGVFPLRMDAGATEGSELGRMFDTIQGVGIPSPADPEPPTELLCRDLAQGITQLVMGPQARLSVFISHTKRRGPGEGDVLALIALVRTIIAETRLGSFFDANDLQPGRDWDDELRAHAATSALLALRTDLYASREWCQREMLIAKRKGMPIVIVDALGTGEERGSFLMDHVPRIPVRGEGGAWCKTDIRRALNLLVDECLKRALWDLQKALSENRSEHAISWWAPHAPEPITFAQWLEDSLKSGALPIGAGAIRILHPDPPLGQEEKAALQQMATLMGHTGSLDLMTPRIIAARSI